MRSRQSETLRLFIIAAFIAALAFSAASSSCLTCDQRYRRVLVNQAVRRHAKERDYGE